METAFYLYTIAIMLVCVTAGALALASYFVSGKRTHLYTMAFFFFYFFDLVLIFQYEYFGQNVAYSLDAFYSIDTPFFKVAFSLGALEALWLIVCDYLNEKNLVLRLAPGIAYVVLATLTLVAIPNGSLQQFLFYNARQLFLIWIIIYCAARYLKTKDELERLSLKRHIPLFAASALLVICIIVEDALMIFVWNPNEFTPHELLPLYMSERNFSENLLSLAFAFFSLRASASTLRLRFNEPPVAETPETLRHVDDLLPAYCARHGLTQRERDVLALVLQGKNNQNIASELQLALGTVKAHTHNILKKTESATRQDLVRDFWKD